jgi:hypothetical protein
MKRVKIITIIVLAFIILASGGSLVAAKTKTLAVASDLGKYYVFVSPDNYYKFRGDWVTFYGSHFAPNENVNIMRGGVRIDTVKARADGTFITPQYQVPFTDQKVSYLFIGTKSLLSYKVTVTVSGGGPWITLSDYYAPAGSLVTVIGHNYSKNEQVNVWFDGVYQGAVMTDARGNFNKVVVIPNGGSGQRIVQAVGVKSKLAATQTFSQAVSQLR